MTVYKCPYCGKEYDHLLVYFIHITEKCERRPKEQEQQSFSFTLSGGKRL